MKNALASANPGKTWRQNSAPSMMPTQAGPTGPLPSFARLKVSRSLRAVRLPRATPRRPLNVTKLWLNAMQTADWPTMPCLGLQSFGLRGSRTTRALWLCLNASKPSTPRGTCFQKRLPLKKPFRLPPTGALPQKHDRFPAQTARNPRTNPRQQELPRHLRPRQPGHRPQPTPTRPQARLPGQARNSHCHR